MKASLRITIGFLIALAATTVLGALAYRSTERQIAAHESLAHTYEVIGSLDDVLTALVDAESGQRGFVITGDERYLEPYRAAQAGIATLLKSVRDLMKDDPAQQRSLDGLEVLAAARFSELDETVRLRREGGQAAALPVISSGRGRQIMDEARSRIAAMQAVESNLLEQRQHEATDSARRTTLVVAAGGPLLVIALGVAVLLITSGLTDRLRRQTLALDDQNEELTRQSEELSEQTEELSQQTEELTQQSEELSRQNEEMQAQTEEIHSLNAELGRRENLLQSLLDSARMASSEQAALRDICAAALDLFAPTASSAVVYERQAGRLIVRAAAGLSQDMPASFAAEHRFAELVVDENRTASLNDASLRPDLSMLPVAGQPPFQSILAAPMRAAGQAFGAVAIYSQQPVEWNAEQFRLAEWLAGQCAQILEILRLQVDLRRNTALYSQLFENLLDGFAYCRMLFDAQHRPVDFEYLRVNRAFARLTGLRNVVGRRVTEVIPGIRESNPELFEIYGRVATTGKPEEFEVYLDALKMWLSVAVYQPEPDHFVAVFDNVTDRKMALEALRESDRRKSEFLATLSHELRNPLAPIRYALELLRCEDDEREPTHPKRVIERQLGHLVRLVDDLLDVTRVASNKVRLRKRAVSLNDIVQHAVEATTPDIERGQHALILSLPPDPVWLDADPDRLAQVLTNLLNNAARYTPRGGRVALAASVDGDDVVIGVSDTGIGLRPEDCSRVFEMFTQVGEPGQGGLGIGLALVKGLVEMHGGRIEARSDGPGRGSEFIVRLPSAREPATEAAGVASRAETAVGRRVLVVDDNVDSAEMLKTVLELHGHEVRVVHDAASALAMLEAFDAEIGLFDIGLPGMNGYELARRVRADGHHRMFLVALTGWGQEEDRQRAHECGFDAHLTKPADPEELQRVIAQMPNGEENP